MRNQRRAVLGLVLLAAVASCMKVPDARESRQTIQRARLVFRPFVFSGKQLPPVDFEHPAAVRKLIGPYKLRTTYYDASFRRVLEAQRPGRYGAIVEIMPKKGEATKRFVTLYCTPRPINWRSREIGGALWLSPEFGIHPDVLKGHADVTSEFLKWELRSAFGRSARCAVHFAGLHETEPGAPLLARTSPWALDARWWHELKKQTGNLEPLRYLTHLPPGAERDRKRWPAILFLHGAGERGDDLALVEKHGPPKIVKTRTDFPFIVISPQCPRGQWWSAPALEDLVTEVLAKYPIDPERFYLTGLSMGGFGSWSLACEHPDWFAAVVPICGAGDPYDVERIKDVPIWVFHGARDRVVPPSDSAEMVEALREVGGRVRFTLYPEAAHDSWTDTYNNEALYQWLLQQRRGKPAEPKAATKGRAPSH